MSDDTDVTVQPDSEAPTGFGDLESIPEEDLGTATTYVYRLADDGRKVPASSGGKLYLAKFVGRIVDFDELRDRWGGGSFLVMVTARGGKMLRRVRVDIEGAPKLVSAEVPAAPVNDVDRLAIVVSAALAPVLEQLASVVKAVAESRPSQENATPQLSMVDMFAVMERSMKLGRDTATVQPAASTEKMLEMFERGMKLGRDTEQGGPTVGQALIEIAPKTLETLSNIGTAMAANGRRGPMRMVQRPARPGAPGQKTSLSTAVVEGDAAATPEPSKTDVVGRVRWLVEYLDAMRAAGGDPVKVADVVEDLLSVFEIKKLASYVRDVDGQPAVDTAAVIAELGQVTPVPEGLASDGGQVWLAEFLARLAEPTEEDDEASPAPTS